jgi:hypothetical protein
MTQKEALDAIRRIQRAYATICLDALPNQSVVLELNDDIEREIGRVRQFFESGNSPGNSRSVVENLRAICKSAETVSGVKAIARRRSSITDGTLDVKSASSLHDACRKIDDCCVALSNFLSQTMVDTNELSSEKS